MSDVGRGDVFPVEALPRSQKIPPGSHQPVVRRDKHAFGMCFKKSDLLLEALWMTKVIRVHPGDKIPADCFDTCPKGCEESAVGNANYSNAGIRNCLQNVTRTISRTVVDDKKFEF